MSRKRKHKVIASREKMKELIPSGYGVKICELAGVSEQALCDYWNGSNSPRIATAVKIVLHELIELEREMKREAEKLFELKGQRK